MPVLGKGEVEYPWAWGRFDYLKVTVWASVAEVQERLELGIVERYAAATFVGWVDRGAARRISHTWEAANLVRILEYGADSKYVSIELRGEACGLLGNEGVRLLLCDLEGMKWRASRCDFAWDGFPATVEQVKAATKAGWMNSRQFKAASTGFEENEQGQTVYVQGRQGRRGDALLRAYDRRGPVRLELELKGEKAASACALLVMHDCSLWPTVMLQMLRSIVDFVERSGGGRADRAPMLSWWQQFVGDAPVLKIPKLGKSRAVGPTAIGKADGCVQRNWRRLEIILRAFGPEWLVERVTHHGLGKWGPADDEAVAELEQWKGTGIAGVPAGGGVIPF